MHGSTLGFAVTSTFFLSLTVPASSAPLRNVWPRSASPADPNLPVTIPPSIRPLPVPQTVSPPLDLLYVSPPPFPPTPGKRFPSPQDIVVLIQTFASKLLFHEPVEDALPGVTKDDDGEKDGVEVMLVNCAKLKAGCRRWAGQGEGGIGFGEALALLQGGGDANLVESGDLVVRRRGRRWASAEGEDGEGNVSELVRGLALTYEAAGHVLSTAAEGYWNFGLDGSAQKFLVRTAAAGTGRGGLTVPEGEVVAVGFLDFKETRMDVAL